VLVVEDHADSREALQLLLELDGLEVFTAADGPSGIELARAQVPVIAIIDIGLPRLDGWGVARTLRQELSDRVWLIALTSLDAPEDRRRSAEAGFDLHLAKPVRGDEIRELVQSMLLHA
jgi:DNA-binding response OmpR family regulator